MVIAASDKPIIIQNTSVKTTSLGLDKAQHIVGKKLSKPYPPSPQAKVAVICNWNLPCGISTYTKFLIDSLKNKVKEIRIFSEEGQPLSPDENNVTRCWVRGKSMNHVTRMIQEWDADFVIVQHEYGIFPNACYFLQMLQQLRETPYVIAMHSVYEHLDKTICTSAVENMIVHSYNAKKMLEHHGHTNKIFVVNHGHSPMNNDGELWNIFQTPYAIVQFGFGFHYKGVDRALEAIALLKRTDSKFHNIFYCYLCAENPLNTAIHDQYYYYLMDRVRELDVENNVAIVRGYQDEKILSNYLRTAKLAIFPYLNNPNNKVFGASGAIRIAITHRIPIIASESHLFDDLEGVLPRPANVEDLAKEIDVVFSDDAYRRNILTKAEAHAKKYTWDYCAGEYMAAYENIISSASASTSALEPC